MENNPNPSQGSGAGAASDTGDDRVRWSKHAKEYSKLASMGIYFNNIIAEICVQEVRPPKGCKVLDVCAGPGIFTVALINSVGVEHAMSFKLLVSDFAPGMVYQAKAAVEAAAPGHPDAEFKVIDVQNIELPANEWDIVACIFGYFVPNRVLAFSEVCRVCKSGGKAIIGTWKYAGLMYIFNDFLQFLGRETPLDMSAVHACADADELRNELTGVGFSHVVVHERTKVFDIAQTNEVVDAMFTNPMFAKELTAYDAGLVKEKWFEFLSQPPQSEAFPHEVKRAEDNTLVLYMTYTANIAIATK